MYDNSLKHHIGKFSITDKNSALVVTGKIEQAQSFVSELFFVELFPFDKSSSSISIAFNAVELRGFLNQLEEFHMGVAPIVKKHSGGKNNSKSITFSNSMELENYLVEFIERDKKILFPMPRYLLAGFIKQATHLVDATMSATYKAQRIAIKKSK